MHVMLVAIVNLVIKQQIYIISKLFVMFLFKLNSKAGSETLILIIRVESALQLVRPEKSMDEKTIEQGEEEK